jgi:hypothetical protein
MKARAVRYRTGYDRRRTSQRTFFVITSVKSARGGAMITRKGGFALVVASLLLPMVVVVSAAAAQDKPATDRPGAQSNVPSAPVGHRQPTAADVAKGETKADPVDPAIEKRERELNRKLQICRGC